MGGQLLTLLSISSTVAQCVVFFSHDAKAGSPDDQIEQFISRELKERERSCVIDVQSKMDMGHFRHTHTHTQYRYCEKEV